MLHNITKPNKSKKDSMVDLSEDNAEALRILKFQLDVAHNELDALREDQKKFSHAISHDLLSPARQMICFSALLKNIGDSSLDGDACEYIGFIEDAANRQRRLINGLLEFSELQTKAGVFELSDLSVLLEKAIIKMQNVIDLSGTIISHQSMPELYVDQNQLTKAFLVLLDNAIKFNESRTPKINISSEPHVDGWLFRVEDNGIGINSLMREEIFDVFRRLHTDEVYPGIGMGLAIFKSIIKRHSGSVWMEPAKGSGSCFCFTLPVL